MEIAISQFHKQIKLLIVLIVFLFTDITIHTSTCQSNTVSFQTPSSRNKLSQYTVNTIIEDNIGFMWFGTENGLNVYDGYHYKVFKQQDGNPYSISNNVIRTLFEDKDSVLWIGTFNGLNCYNHETENFTHYLHNPQDSVSISNNHILSISEDHLGNLWIGTNYGLNKFNKRSNNFK